MLGFFFSFTCGCVEAVVFSMVYGLVAFWAGAGIICLRRPLEPSKGDIRYLKFGLYLLLGFSYLVSPFVWTFRGVGA
jgi:hypothetical protein